MPVAQSTMPLTLPPGRFALCTRRQWLALALGAGTANALALPARALHFQGLLAPWRTMDKRKQLRFS